MSQKCAFRDHKFEIQHMHCLTVVRLMCYFQDTCFQKELESARSFEVTVNLAVGKEKARCWRNELYAEGRAHPLQNLPLGRLANLLDTKFIGRMVKY